MRDTSPEAERVLNGIYRGMSLQDKWRRWISSCRTARQLHKAGVLLRKPQATAIDIHRDWILQTLGPSYRGLGGAAVDKPPENLDVLHQVVSVFTGLDIPYALGGSLASSLLGKPRFTEDADIAVAPFPGKEETLASAFGNDFYLSLPAICDAVRDRSSFNIIHVPSGFKVDVFVSKERGFDASVMARRHNVALPDRPGETMSVVSAEDIILLKLEWYRLGGEVSDRQWSDIRGVFAVQGDKLDWGYLTRWAADLRVSDLLARAKEEGDPGA